MPQKIGFLPCSVDVLYHFICQKGSIQTSRLPFGGGGGCLTKPRVFKNTIVFFREVSDYHVKHSVLNTMVFLEYFKFHFNPKNL
jgi:hypothetical protein